VRHRPIFERLFSSMGASPPLHRKTSVLGKLYSARMRTASFWEINLAFPSDSWFMAVSKMTIGI